MLLAGCDQSATFSSDVIDLNGRPFDLIRGRDDALASVVIFTRSDCPISNRYAPTVKKLCETYAPRDVQFYLAYVDPKATPDHIRQHMSEFAYPCTGLRDPKHLLVSATGATVTPEAAVFNAKEELVYRGRIDDMYVDYGKAREAATTHELADAIDATLAGKPVAEPFTKAVGCPIGDLQ